MLIDEMLVDRMSVGELSGSTEVVGVDEEAVRSEDLYGQVTFCPIR